MAITDSVLDANPWLDRFFSEISGTSGEQYGIDTIVLRLIAAGVLGWIIAHVYRRTFTGVRFNPTLPDTHTLLALGGAMIWMVVGNNLVRAFGLGGMVGLIRYRTIVPDPKDSTILLFSLLMGMACGLGQVMLAYVAALVLTIVMVLLHFGHRGIRAAEQENLNVLQMFEADKLPGNDPQESGKR